VGLTGGCRGFPKMKGNGGRKQGKAPANGNSPPEVVDRRGKGEVTQFEKSFSHFQKGISFRRWASGGA